MPDQIELFCHGCGARGAVGRVTASLQCRCGSRDLDLWQGTAEQNARIAQLRARTSMWGAETAQIMAAGERNKAESRPLNFSEWMTGRKTAQAPTPKPTNLVDGDVQGWNEYTGPKPSPSGMENGVGTPYVCPVCHGSKRDLQDGGACRECGGSGYVTPNADEHEEVPAVARHNYPSTQTKVPFLGQRKSGTKITTSARPAKPPTVGITLQGAACPRCRCQTTSLITAADRAAWWYCTAKCGALANLDATPLIDPYQPGERFRPNGKAFHAAGRGQVDKTGRLMDLVVNIEKNNPGLSRVAALTLARRTLSYAGSR